MNLQTLELYTLYVSADYDDFESHTLNRVIDSPEGRKDRNKLRKRMQAHGFPVIYAIHVVRTNYGKLRIVDGHRRFDAAKSLGLAVPFITFDEADEVSPLDYSIGQRSWTSADIVHGHARNVADYLEVLEFSEESGLGLGACFAMFGGEIASSRNKNDAIREGRFLIKDRECPRTVAAICRQIDASAAVKFGKTANCVTAVSKIATVPEASMDDLKVRIATKPQLLRPCRTVDDYLDLFETIYNHGRTAEKRFSLKWHVEASMRARGVAPRGKA